MIEKRTRGLSIWLFESLMRCDGIGHFVSTRTGGSSSHPCDSLNLSFDVGDDPENVLVNRRLLAQALKIPLTSFTTAKQIHDGYVKVVSADMRGRGCMDYQQAINATDAMITDVPNTCLMILVADCVPILFCDPSRGAIGVAHAGWKGTLRFVASNTVRALEDAFGCEAKDILVGIGPSVGPCCYQVGPEVVSQAEQVLGADGCLVGTKSKSGKMRLDLWRANLNQLLQAGISEENIEISMECTRDHSDLFFSHRHEKGQTGRFGAGIFIR